jgi:hypothetical protein
MPFRRMAGTPRAFFYSVAASRCAFGGRWDYCAAAPTGHMARNRNPVDGLCLGHAPAGPAPCFCVNGSRGRGIKNRSVFHIHIWVWETVKLPRGLSTKGNLECALYGTSGRLWWSRRRSRRTPLPVAKRLKGLRTNPDFVEAVSGDRAAAQMLISIVSTRPCWTNAFRVSALVYPGSFSCQAPPSGSGIGLRPFPLITAIMLILLPKRTCSRSQRLKCGEREGPCFPESAFGSPRSQGQ